MKEAEEMEMVGRRRPDLNQIRCATRRLTNKEAIVDFCLLIFSSTTRLFKHKPTNKSKFKSKVMPRKQI